MHKRLAFPTIFALSFLIAVPAALALLVPNKSIRGIELRMTPAEVKDAAGKPDRERIIANEIVGKQRVMVYGEARDEKTKVYFSGTRAKSEVVIISTKDRDERTHDGVGIGSTKPEVREALRGERCEREFRYHHCYKGRFRPGKRITDFIFNDRDKVKRINVGIVID